MKFTILIGLSQKGSLQVDLAVGAAITGEVTTTPPATALDLPRLVSHPYRLYPVVDQIADKVCATMTRYSERASSRERDLVDLVEFASALVTRLIDPALSGDAHGKIWSHEVLAWR